MANPTGKGGFKPGQSGNPSGRPKIVAEVQDLACEHTTVAVAALVEVLSDKKSPPSARVAAASALLDRGWGKAVQGLEISGGVTVDIIKDRAPEWLQEALAAEPPLLEHKNLTVDQAIN